MIIDFHAHIFPDALAARAQASLCAGIDNLYTPVTDMTVRGLLCYMDECGIASSVILPVITKPSQTVKTNEWAAGVNSDRIISFGGVHPASDDYKRDIDSVVSLGLKGLKFHPEYQEFLLDDPDMLKIYDYALSRGLILLFHAGYDPFYPPPYRSSPARFANVLDAMRGGVIIAAHMGGSGESEDVLRHLAGRDIYLDTSMGFEYYSHEIFLQIAKQHGTDKLLFATDSPWSAAKTEIEHIKSLPLTDADKEKIFSGNAKRLLGI